MTKRRTDKIEHIMDIATELFSEKGYYATLTDDIAERACINKRSMFYYIGDKSKLYDAVFSKLTDRFAGCLYQELNHELTPEDRLLQMIKGMSRASQLRPFQTIALRKLFAGGKTMPPVACKEIDHMLDEFSSISQEVVPENHEVDAPLIVVGLMAYAFLVYWNVLMPYMRESEETTQRSVIEAIGVENDEVLVQYVNKLVLRMLQLEPPL